MSNLSYEKACEDALKEMFRRVGEEYPNETLTKHEKWYQMRVWTEEEQDDFSNWLKSMLKKRFRHWHKRTINNEAGMFILNWGWTTNPERACDVYDDLREEFSETIGGDEEAFQKWAADEHAMPKSVLPEFTKENQE